LKKNASGLKLPQAIEIKWNMAQGRRVAVAFVPAAHDTPFTVLYIDRSTTIGCVESMTAPNDSSISSGTSLPAPPTESVTRLVAATVTVLVSVVPSDRRKRTVASAASVPGFAKRMNV
jgi:hypothetical protein